MRPAIRIRPLLAWACALPCGALIACAGAAAGPHPEPAPVDGTNTATRAAVGVERLPYTAADVRFMTAMIGHHAQALQMAQLAPERSSDSAILTLARRIHEGQLDEIATMQRWLRDRNQPVPAMSDSDTTHAAHAGDAARAAHAAGMPGMLTASQMRQLEAARGAGFDRLFLTFMIQHHRGAVQMVEQLFATHGAGQEEAVFRFATDVNVDQRTEIARMQRMLEELVFVGGS